ncbi:hypothetical protein ACFFTM_08845 [Pseudoduganella plicata]|uniref:Type III secretion protein n=1 Tax=Pseudoduganella plicata TaxID=321984 RepID=A0A4P7BD53_9BURK|nr:hypothetical protein [Pseudoduganella plicata]QBQ35415.1 hypothetical protein E1742_03975 [Pseudoduganella plicata]GGZ01561.1 hypothetical protein GCM10007388_39090 [Pseudoduganella plicata]
MSSNQNPVLQSLRSLTRKFDDSTDGIADFQRRQTNGEQPDPQEFTRLLEVQSVTHSAMNAQFSLLQKPLKTVLNETR